MELGISDSTVRTCVDRACNKLEVETRMQLALKAQDILDGNLASGGSSWALSTVSA